MSEYETDNTPRLRNEGNNGAQSTERRTPWPRTTHRGRRVGSVNNNAEADMLGASTLELAGIIESLAVQIMDPMVIPDEGAGERLTAARDEWGRRKAFVRAGGDLTDVPTRVAFAVQLQATQLEVARRRRLAATGSGVASPDDPRWAAWHQLRERVRVEADILSVFAAGGWELRRAGRSGRSGEEWSGQCFNPCCEPGHDRLRVWTAPGRFWCRRCGFGGDAISATRNLIAGAESYPAALRWLADGLGIPWPDERKLLGGAR